MAKKFLFSLVLIAAAIVSAVAQVKWDAINAPDDAGIAWPRARAGHGMVYMKDAKKLFLFGGFTYTNDGADYYLNDTWLFDVKTLTWEKLDPKKKPLPRANFAMAYDADEKVVILHGGDITTGNANKNHNTSAQTWKWDGDNWSQIHDNLPGARAGHSMVYDTKHKQMLMYGGGTYNEVNGDDLVCDSRLFAFADNSWKELFPARTPEQRYGHTMAINRQGRLVMTTGVSQGDGRFFRYFPTDIFEYSAAAGWRTLHTYRPEEFDGRIFQAMAHDATRNEYVAFGGAHVVYEQTSDYQWFYYLKPTDDYWVLHEGKWREVEEDGSNQPSPRLNATMVCDEYNDVLWVFGGQLEAGHEAGYRVNNEEAFDATLYHHGQLNVQPIDLVAMLMKFNPVKERKIGDTINYLFRVRNKSSAIAEGFSASFYLSRDKTLDEADILVNTAMVTNRLKPRGSFRFKVVDTITEDWPKGDYYLIVDLLSTQPEKSEDNNIAASTDQLTIK